MGGCGTELTPRGTDHEGTRLNLSFGSACRSNGSRLVRDELDPIAERVVDIALGLARNHFDPDTYSPADVEKRAAVCIDGQRAPVVSAPPPERDSRAVFGSVESVSAHNDPAVGWGQP